MTKETLFRGFIRLVFLIAYGAFLWASIRHVAYFFSAFEPSGIDMTGPYAIAISIDVTALVLTAGLLFFRSSMSKQTTFGIGFFVVFLMAISWVMNWEYAFHFQHADLTSNPILMLLNPILASSFTFLNLAYTIAADMFTAKPKTAEDLAQEADRLEALETQQKRINDYQERHKKPGLFRRLATTYKDAKEAFDDVSKPSENALIEPDRIAELEDHSDLQTPSLSQGINETEMTDNSPIEMKANTPFPSIPTEYEEVITRYPYVQSWLSTGQKTATIEEIVETTGHSKRRISNRINDNILKRSSRNPNLIIIRSVLEWLKTASMPNQNGEQTGEMAVVKPISNGHHSPDNETLVIEAKA